MTGQRHTKEELNNTLLFVIRLLNEHNLTDWFLGYGTLLGIIREDSCIDGDDDIDIVININNYDVLKKILVDSGLEIEYGYGIRKSRHILKTKATENYSTIDFYMANVDEQGNFIDIWEKVVWSNCYNETRELVQSQWNNEKVYLPNNYITKLENRYGDWKTPKNEKSPVPRKMVI